MIWQKRTQAPAAPTGKGKTRKQPSQGKLPPCTVLYYMWWQQKQSLALAVLLRSKRRDPGGLKSSSTQMYNAAELLNSWQTVSRTLCFFNTQSIRKQARCSAVPSELKRKNGAEQLCCETEQLPGSTSFHILGREHHSSANMATAVQWPVLICLMVSAHKHVGHLDNDRHVCVNFTHNHCKSLPFHPPA